MPRSAASDLVMYYLPIQKKDAKLKSVKRKIVNIFLSIRDFKFLASLCSWGDGFETRVVGHTEDRFSHDEAQ